ncbi:Receptor homology region, transmembrane domain- and RING domain-containing protein 4 [Smittium mucronatum]|uniref:RING-type E3 ubiquitin transferase n=1 Tax=Smittium mucronatum TaxID=133383 RepID=A0A1R0H7X4_9FUNG|nr:Receptor homology region, transmembrane domain- and RING domain-containing protein 4 [Smittium mucronatum]
MDFLTSTSASGVDSSSQFSPFIVSTSSFDQFSYLSSILKCNNFYWYFYKGSSTSPAVIVAIVVGSLFVVCIRILKKLTPPAYEGNGRNNPNRIDPSTGLPYPEGQNGNSANPSNRLKSLSKEELETYPVVKFSQSMIRKPTQIKQEKDEIFLDLESQEAKKDKPHMLKSASKVLTDTLSSAKNLVTGGGGDANTNQEKDDVNYGNECMICFEKINIGDDIRIIPCLHKFHRECLDQWLLERVGSCPNCRMDLHIQQEQDQPPSSPDVSPTPPAETSEQSARNHIVPGLSNIFQSSSSPSSGEAGLFSNNEATSQGSNHSGNNHSHNHHDHAHNPNNQAINITSYGGPNMH